MITKQENTCHSNYFGIIGGLIQNKLLGIVQNLRRVNMKPITLEEALTKYVEAILKNGWAPSLYLKDICGDYHEVDRIDLMHDELRSDDGYYDYCRYILEAEDEKEYRLFTRE
jgi:hypothetical protein